MAEATEKNVSFESEIADLSKPTDPSLPDPEPEAVEEPDSGKNEEPGEVVAEPESGSAEPQRVEVIPKRPKGRPAGSDPTLKIELLQGRAPKKKEELSREEDSVPLQFKSNQREFDEIMNKYEFSSTGGAFASLIRQEPNVFQQKKIGGFIARFYERLDCDLVQARYGGGTYDVLVHTYGKDGKPHIAERVRLVISGDPNINSIVDNNKKSDTSMDIVNRTLDHNEKFTERVLREKEAAIGKADDLTKMLLAKMGGSDDGKSVAILKDIMDHQKKMTEDLLKRAQEGEKEAREALVEAQKEFKEELRSMKAEIEHKTEQGTTPLLTMLQTQSADADRRQREANEKSESLFKEMMKQQENMLKMVIEVSKIGQESQKSVFETQLALAEKNASFKDAMVTEQMKEMREELRSARNAKPKSLIEQINEFKTIKEVLGGEKEAPAEEKISIADRIFENLDQLPAVAQAIGSLFSKGQPVVMGQVPQLPPGQMAAPAQQAAPMTEPAIDHEAIQNGTKRQAMEFQVVMTNLVKDAEVAVSSGAEPVKFADEKVIPVLNPEMLKKVADIPVNMIILGLEQQINAVGGDSVLLTENGREFMKKVHARIVESVSK